MHGGFKMTAGQWGQTDMFDDKLVKAMSGCKRYRGGLPVLSRLVGGKMARLEGRASVEPRQGQGDVNISWTQPGNHQLRCCQSLWKHKLEGKKVQKDTHVISHIQRLDKLYLMTRRGRWKHDGCRADLDNAKDRVELPTATTQAQDCGWQDRVYCRSMVLEMHQPCVLEAQGQLLSEGSFWRGGSSCV